MSTWLPPLLPSRNEGGSAHCPSPDGLFCAHEKTPKRTPWHRRLPASRHWPRRDPDDNRRN